MSGLFDVLTDNFDQFASGFWVTVRIVGPDRQGKNDNHANVGFERPNPFRPDIAVSIDDVAEKKLSMLDAHDTHFTFGENIGAP